MDYVCSFLSDQIFLIECFLFLLYNDKTFFFYYLYCLVSCKIQSQLPTMIEQKNTENINDTRYENNDKRK